MRLDPGFLPDVIAARIGLPAAYGTNIGSCGGFDWPIFARKADS